jgi:hypothetical protein
VVNGRAAECCGEGGSCWQLLASAVRTAGDATGSRRRDETDSVSAPPASAAGLGGRRLAVRACGHARSNAGLLEAHTQQPGSHHPRAAGTLQRCVLTLRLCVDRLSGVLLLDDRPIVPAFSVASTWDLQLLPFLRRSAPLLPCCAEAAATQPHRCWATPASKILAPPPCPTSPPMAS